jgi:hypothetical protein
MIFWLLLLSGGTAIFLSIVFESSIAAFIGLGLILWSIIMLYVGPQDYVQESMIATIALPSLVNLNLLIKNLGYQGKAFYLPPRYLKDFESSKIYVSAEENAEPPTAEQIGGNEDKVFLKNPDAVVIEPPGLELSRLFEKTLGTKFTTMNLQLLQKNMAHLFLEDLEMASNFEIVVNESRVHVTIKDCALKDLCREVRNLSHIYGKTGCPVSSAIGCALARVTGKLLMIEKELISPDGGNIDVEYRILDDRP